MQRRYTKLLLQQRLYWAEWYVFCPNAELGSQILMSTGWGGGLADHIVVPTSTLYRLPDNVPLEIGGM
jgi:threonine dehydrogenase-like Zn-dependent dehydrogenase